MLISRYVLNLVSLGLAAFLAACSSTPEARHPASLGCKQDPQDPFEPDLRMPARPGEQNPEKLPCINSALARPVEILTRSQVRAYLPANEGSSVSKDEIVFGNFIHQGKPWIARVRPDAVESISFNLEYFPAAVPAAHSFLRFHLTPGSEMTLYPQRSGDRSTPVKIRSFVYSVEANGPVGYKYDLLSGLLDKYVIVYRFYSLEYAAQTMIHELDHLVDQFELHVSPADRAEVLRFALQESQDNGLNKFYNTLTKNCTTEPYAALDHAINYRGLNDIRSFLTQHRNPLPTLAERALKARGILERKGMPLNQEIDPTWKPTLQQAKAGGLSTTGLK